MPESGSETLAAVCSFLVKNPLEQFPETEESLAEPLSSDALKQLGLMAFKTMPVSHRARPEAVIAARRKIIVSYRLSGGTGAFNNEMEFRRSVSFMARVLKTCDETAEVRLKFKSAEPESAERVESSSPVSGSRSAMARPPSSNASSPSGKASDLHMETIVEQRRMQVTPADVD